MPEKDELHTGNFTEYHDAMEILCSEEMEMEIKEATQEQPLLYRRGGQRSDQVINQT